MIKKEILLRVTPEIVWRFITGKIHLGGIWNSRVEYDLKIGGEIRLLDTSDAVKITELKANKLLSLKGGYGTFPVVTTYTLTKIKTGTILKITLSGWDDFDQDEIRRKIPSLSYEWEKRLISIKKTLESKEISTSGPPKKTARKAQSASR